MLEGKVPEPQQQLGDSFLGVLPFPNQIDYHSSSSPANLRFASASIDSAKGDLTCDLKEADELSAREPQDGSISGLLSQDWKILSNCTSSSSFVKLPWVDDLLHT